MSNPTTVLVVGATGSIGQLAVEEALRQGYATRALVRDLGKARRLPAAAEIVVGDVTLPETLTAAVDGSTPSSSPMAPRRRRPRRKALTTAGCATSWSPRLAPGPHCADDGDRRHQPHRRLQPFHGGARLETPLRAAGARQRIAVHDRSARLVRLQRPDQHRLVLLQGDTRQAGNSSDGVIARRQLAEVLSRA